MKKQHDDTPWIKLVVPTMVPPSLKDNTGDVDRLINALKNTLKSNSLSVEFALIKKIPPILRKYNYKIAAAAYLDPCGWRLIDIYPSTDRVRLYGLAVDLGSSTVVVRLYTLSNGEKKDEASFPNPQMKIGMDILTRIHFASQTGGLERLQRILIVKLNHAIKTLLKKNEINSRHIVGMSAAGNTTMTHLFLGIDPYRICREPYLPAVNTPPMLTAEQLDLMINPLSPVLVFPNVGSYFGGDLIAGIIAAGLAHRSEISCLIDVGTNAEVVVGNRDWLIGCAGAAGPALEGGVATIGMMAGPGVIDQVRINPHSTSFELHTIENRPPIGICGSGLIDLVAQCFLWGWIDVKGKFVTEKCANRLIEIDRIHHLVLATAKESGTGQALTLSQPDIDALIRSKAAMYAILTTISNMIHTPLNKIPTFFIAGTFGTYIRPRSAIAIGMVPDLPINAFVGLGNTSIEGASLTLLSLEAREEIYRIRDKITYVELNVNQDFMNIFSAAKFLPHTDRSLFPSVSQKTMS